jgi:Putative MetA-pathway of phenol degradation
MSQYAVYHYSVRHAKYFLAIIGLVNAVLIPRATFSQTADTSSRSRNPHAVQPERPTVATHAGTVARGWMELEEGGEWDRAPDKTKSFFAPTNLKTGLGSRAQLNLMINVIKATGVARGNFSPGDLTIGIKYRIVDDERLLGDFAVLPAIKFPTASQSSGAGTGTTDLSLLLISSRNLGPVSMDLNIGGTWRSANRSGAPRTAAIWTASFGFPLIGQSGLVAEVFGYPRTSHVNGAAPIAAFLTGPTFTAREWLAFDAGVIVPITGAQPHAAYAGFVWNLGCVLPRGSCR